MTRSILAVAAAGLIAYAVFAVGLAPAKQQKREIHAEPAAARLHTDATRHDTKTTFANRVLSNPKLKQKLGIHLADHRWLWVERLSRLPLHQRLRAYSAIVAHDNYLVGHRKTCHCPKVVARHMRERRHARAHIAKINAKLHPPFSYPWWWIPLGRCETGVYPPDPAYGAPGHPGGDGYEGWINFAPSTWDTYKGYVAGASQYANAYDAPEYVQYLVTMAMHNAGNSWGQSNPACSRLIGLS